MKTDENNKNSYNTKFRYDDNCSDYVVRLKKKKYKWLWLLLLLLLLPLLIKCSKDVTVKVVDEVGAPCTETDVMFSYVAHFLYDNKQFFTNEPYKSTQQTDNSGTAVFKDLRFSVYSFVFYCMSKVEISAVSECTELTENSKPLFHFIGGKKPVRLVMKTQYVNVPLKVVDDELNSPIADATIYYEYEYNGAPVRDSIKTNANGDATILHFPKCHYFNLIKTSQEGYETDERSLIKAFDLIASDQIRTIRLKPLKANFNFYVKNKFSHEPIPGATAYITLNDNRTGKSVTSVSTTNVDGLGRGFYDDAFLLVTAHIKASKLHFKDGELSGNYAVKQFITLSDEERTIYLEPDPYTVEFQNIDSITHEPVAGVENAITVYSVEGKTERYTEIGNRNGFFNVKAHEGDKVEIVSTLLPPYRVKETVIEKFEKGDTIPLSPYIVSLDFRTIEGYSLVVLPDCDLQVVVDGQILSSITNSGTGEFTIPDLRLNQSVSIAASKDSYLTNDTKVRNEDVAYLAKAPQSARDIPLNFPPCNTPKAYSGDMKGSILEYDMGQPSGVFNFQFNTGNAYPDSIIIYDGKGTFGQVIFQYAGITSVDVSERVPFHDRIVTIKIISWLTETSWSYTVSCPE